MNGFVSSGEISGTPSWVFNFISILRWCLLSTVASLLPAAIIAIATAADVAVDDFPPLDSLLPRSSICRHLSPSFFLSTSTSSAQLHLLLLQPPPAPPCCASSDRLPLNVPLVTMACRGSLQVELPPPPLHLRLTPGLHVLHASASLLNHLRLPLYCCASVAYIRRARR